ncbi:MAG TPA: D-glycero-beta-D-manno-heptose 1-phosphate adenylyltransferase [Pusillimonas sp.]|uniref:D-glycero-beta-D-manno-heptose 1-phosphate adenylyltransferase n=1 Tax=unclassified Pusillimonas TaxID=2640016 RepID=UPI002630943D|nr:MULTISPECIES: D-glycero-beta-D-manno-heptose 1-phosphate adenylyltransferase [unclassified Pusillimonas]HLU18828.1 D-glycero-beta-D-manno-heptose 1-phosphate adenylyltransferase [Pusillimonas sp.]
MSVRFESKMLTRDECIARSGEFARPLVFTNGVFDILHRGHATYLDKAAQLGATLIVAVNTDDSVKRLGKGADRPLNSQSDRAALLAALSSVSYVTSFHEDTPFELISELRPDIIVKGGDYDMKALPETALVESWGGRAVAIPFEFERSTTALINKIRA